jgi:hypothetical protein
MFKITKNRRIEWPVTIQVPQPGGKTIERVADVEFEDLPQSEQDRIYQDGGDDVTLMKRVVKGWGAGQFKDEADNDIGFSDESLALLLDIAYVRNGFIKAYLELHGGRAAARKN